MNIRPHAPDVGMHRDESARHWRARWWGPLAAGFLLMLVVAIAPATAAINYGYVTLWGSSGSGNGQFYSPYGVAVDSSGNVYVVDTGNNRIQKFSATGTYLAQWGTPGTGNGQFSGPTGIAVAGSGTVYVVDSGSRVEKFDANGTYLAQWGSSGSGNGQFVGAGGVAVDSSGNVYVADTINSRIEKFDANGTYLAQWGSSGSGNGQFSAPGGIAVDSSGNVYIADTGNNRIEKFSATGTYLTQWGTPGTGNGQFRSAEDLTVDSAGNIFVADSVNDRIEKFSATGTYLTQFGSAGSGNGQFSYPLGLALDSAGTAYVADYLNNRIETFRPGVAPSIEKADLSAGLICPAHVRRNHSFVCRLVVTNLGPTLARTVKITITAPAHTFARSGAHPGASRVSRITVLWMRTSLGAHAHAAYSLGLRTLRLGTLVIGASVSSSTPDPNRHNNFTHRIVRVAR